jgi:hypothetical protein
VEGLDGVLGTEVAVGRARAAAELAGAAVEWICGDALTDGISGRLVCPGVDAVSGAA